MKELREMTIKMIEERINERAETGCDCGESGMVELANAQGLISDKEADRYFDCIRSMSRVDEQEEEKKEISDKEIKKAWDTMKKELKKEFKNTRALHYGFVMNAKQIKNRTATFTATGCWEYDRFITYHENEIKKVMSFETWTDEEKQRSKARDEESIEILKEKKATYGTIANEAKAYYEMIKNSEAFSKFSKAVGNAEMYIEKDNEGFYRIRFAY